MKTYIKHFFKTFEKKIELQIDGVGQSNVVVFISSPH